MDKVQKWVDIVREDLSLDINDEFITTVAPFCEQIEFEDKGYSLMTCNKNIINKQLGLIISFYLKPEYRNYKNFKKLLTMSEERAKELNCVSLSFGCEIGYKDKQVYKMLDRCGYTNIASVRKEF